MVRGTILKLMYSYGSLDVCLCAYTRAQIKYIDIVFLYSIATVVCDKEHIILSYIIALKEGHCLY